MARCTVTVPDRHVSGDVFYGNLICSQNLIDYFWNTYGFEGHSEYWDDGFGYEDPCNTAKPLARTFGACYVLSYSADDYANDGYDGPILNWARRYVHDQIDDLRAKCGDGNTIAKSYRGFWVNDRVEVYLGFFYKLAVPERAAALVHEARHMGGKGHDAKFPAGSVFGEGENGADSNWGYEGAWMFTVLYLWWFYIAGMRTTPALRERARQFANMLIDNAFAEHPGFNI